MIVTLTWKKRFPKWKRTLALSEVQQWYPHAKDIGKGIQIRSRKMDTKPVWLFLLSKGFANIE